MPRDLSFLLLDGLTAAPKGPQRTQRTRRFLCAPCALWIATRCLSNWRSAPHKRFFGSVELIIVISLSKRLFELVIAASGLLLLTPFFLLIATLVKLDSRGPIFFRGARRGRGGAASIAFRREELLLHGPAWQETHIRRVLPAKLNLELAYLQRRAFWTDLETLADWLGFVRSRRSFQCGWLC